jgi:hydrogenase maturation protease
MNDAKQIRIVGCGRAHRRDDQFGLRVAAALAADAPAGCAIETTEAPGADLIGGLEDVALLIVVDAAAQTPHLPAGQWVRIDYDREAEKLEATLGPRAPLSGHTLGVAAALELGRTLGVLPAEVWVYVAAGADFGYGTELSAGVAAAVTAVAERIRADVLTWRRATPDRRSR